MKYSKSKIAELRPSFTDEIKKDIIAFANTCGGTIYIGVEDDGTVCGTNNAKLIIQQVLDSVKDSVKPEITMFIQCHMQKDGGKDTVKVEVQCGTHRPYYLAGHGMRPEGVYVRQGAFSVPASDMLIRQMIKETSGDAYEEMRSLEQNLTFGKAEKEFEKRGLPFDSTQMKSLGIIGNDGLFSNLALLLSDQCPHIIKAATFNGANGQNFHDRREFKGSLLQQLEDACSYIDLRNSISDSFDTILRVDNKSYPGTALCESLMNAVVHRDYAVTAATILNIYNDRIEIVSVGGLTGGMSYDDIMLGVSRCRNKKLADVFYRLQLIEGCGTGIGRIMSSYKDAVRPPQIQVTYGAFKITLPDMNSAAAKEPARVIRVGAKEKKHILLELFKERNKLTRAEAETALGVSTSTARRTLQDLVGDGMIETVGKGKKAIYVYRK